jgi:hypothetical protein
MKWLTDTLAPYGSYGYLLAGALAIGIVCLIILEVDDRLRSRKLSRLGPDDDVESWFRLVKREE